MRRQEFNFDLPQQLIAQRPPAVRGSSRLLVMARDSGAVTDQSFTDLPNWLKAGDLLVFNDTQVIKARLLGEKATGGKVELLMERLLDEHTAMAQVRASKAPRTATMIRVADQWLEVTGRDGPFFLLRSELPLLTLLQRHGHVPLPPYIERPDDSSDDERYQTVYASNPGAVAAPTAGLHFTEPLLAQLHELGVQTGFLTLHVGAGTFSPIRVDQLSDHRMHSEWGEVSTGLADQIAATRAAGGRIVAVGTTTVRTLESAWDGRRVSAWRGETDIFIHPGIAMHSCDGLLTNFHLPQSTLIMLVCAFAGHQPVLAAYRHAVNEGYRFFSYGDAMLLL